MGFTGHIDSYTKDKWLKNIENVSILDVDKCTAFEYYKKLYYGLTVNCSSLKNGTPWQEYHLIVAPAMAAQVYNTVDHWQDSRSKWNYSFTDSMLNELKKDLNSMLESSGRIMEFYEQVEPVTKLMLGYVVNKSMLRKLYNELFISTVIKTAYVANTAVIYGKMTEIMELIDKLPDFITEPDLKNTGVDALNSAASLMV